MRAPKTQVPAQVEALTQERGVPRVEQLRPEVGATTLQRGD